MSSRENAGEARFAARLARALVGHPWRVVLLAFLLSGAGALLAWRGLRFEVDRMALIGSQHRYNRNFAALQEEFGDLDAMVVVLAAPTRDVARAAADDLAARLRADPARFPALFARVPPEALAGRALLFLTPAQLEGIEARLRAGRPAVSALFRAGLGAFFQESAAAVRALGETAAAAGELPAGEDPLAFLEFLCEGIERALRGQAPGAPPWSAWIPPGALSGRDGSMWTQDGRLVLLVQPHREGGLESGAESVRVLRTHLRELRRDHPHVQPGLTGEPVLEVDELATFRRDASLATVASLVGVTLLFVLSFRRLLGPVLALLALSCAVLSTLGIATLWPGHLNLISVAFCALMVGLGIDYGIHLISRYDEERGRGLDPRGALAAALLGAGRAIAGGALTTALAFLATLFTEVQGIREFGVVAGAGVVLSLGANLCLLPALVVLADRGRGGRPGRPRGGWASGHTAAALDRLVERRPGILVASGLALAVGALVYALAPISGEDGARLRYNANLLKLQAQGLESVRLAGEVLSDPGLSGMFAAIVAEDLPTLARLRDAAEALPSVAGSDSILDVLPPEQARKRVILQRLGQVVRSIPRAETGENDPPAASAAAGLEALVVALEEAARGALAAEDAEVVEGIVALQERLERLAGLLEAAGAPARLRSYEQELRGELATALSGLARESAAEELRVADLPASVRDRFVGRSGSFILRVYPAGDVWEQAGLERFVTELQGLAPDVGGVPVQFHESDRLIRAGYARAGRLALLFVFAYLVLHFRGLIRPVVAMTTLLVGASWALGCLALLGLEVNPASLLALPLICGIGVDYAIHIVHRDREARAVPSVAGAPTILATSTGRAVLLSAATTLVGFGVLMLSAHRGIASIGWTLCLGVVCSLAAALLFCPALLRLRAGSTRPLALGGSPGPKTGPGGGPRR